MIFESIKIGSTLDISLIFAVFGAVVFYFGKLISEVQPTKENNYTNYIAGLFFVLLYLIFPFAILMQYSSWALFIPYKFWWILSAFFIQSILFYFLYLRVTMFNIQKNEFENLFNEEIVKRSKNIIDKVKFNKLDENSLLNFAKGFFASKLGDNSLFVIMFIITWLTLNIVAKSSNLVLQSAVVIYFLLSISNVAILYSWNQVKQYPYVKIILDNKKEIDGKLIKIEEDYITVRTRDKIEHINKDKVEKIEKNMVFPVLNPTILEKIVDSATSKSKNIATINKEIKK